MGPLLSYVELNQAINNCHQRNALAVAFVPVGCTEQHGPLLPLQTDSLIAEGIATALASALDKERFWGFVFPALHYTPTRSNAAYPGTVTIEEDTLRALARDILEGVAGNGFEAVVFVSGHGPADPILREICFKAVSRQYAGSITPIRPAILVSLSQHGHVLEELFGLDVGRHADWRELLFLMHTLGEAYFTKERLEALAEFQRNNSFESTQSLVIGVPLERRSVQGVIGDPIPQGRSDWMDMARQAWDATVSHLAALLQKDLETHSRPWS